MSNFDSTPLTCDLTMFPGKNYPNITKSSHIFPGKGRWDKEFILKYLDSLMTEVFPHDCFFFFFFFFFFFLFWSSPGGKEGSKLDQKCQLWVRPFSINNRIFQTFFKQCFCVLDYYLCWEFRQYWTILGD